MNINENVLSSDTLNTILIISTFLASSHLEVHQEYNPEVCNDALCLTNFIFNYSSIITWFGVSGVSAMGLILKNDDTLSDKLTKFLVCLGFNLTAGTIITGSVSYIPIYPTLGYSLLTGVSSVYLGLTGVFLREYQVRPLT